MIRLIAARELRALFASPLAWGVLGLSQFVLAWRFLQLVDEYQRHYQPLLAGLETAYGVTELVAARFLGDAVPLMFLLLLAALLAMRAIAEERRAGSLPLLLAAPVSSTEIVLGKYLGNLCFLLIALALWALMPFSLQLGTALDVGRLAAGLFGLALLGAALLAVAIWASSLTAQPGLAAAVTFALGLLLMLLHLGGRGEDNLFQYLGSLPHYDQFLAGRVHSTALSYFLLLVLGFLGFAVRRLDASRVQS